MPRRLDERLHVSEAELAPEPPADLAVGAAGFGRRDDLLEHVLSRILRGGAERVERLRYRLRPSAPPSRP